MQSVFLVEDSPLVLERLKTLLAPVAGLNIVGEASGVDEAIAGIRSAKPDVVVLDLSLSPGSGFDVLAALKDSPSRFYVLSNFASEPYRRHARLLGAAGFFDKTNEFERVRDVIAQNAVKH